MQPFFTSDKCRDFAVSEAPSQQAQRPFKSNSQCSKLLAALENGQTLTAMSAIQLCGGTEGPRRLREVRKYLAGQGRVVHTERVKTAGGAHIKQYKLI